MCGESIQGENERAVLPHHGRLLYRGHWWWHQKSDVWRLPVQGQGGKVLWWNTQPQRPEGGKAIMDWDM